MKLHEDRGLGGSAEIYKLSTHRETYLRPVLVKKSEIFLSKVEAKPDNMLFRFSLGQALYDEGATAEAIPHLQRCCDSRADWMLPRILLGKALLQTGAAASAQPILADALELAVAQHHDDPAAELRSILADFES